MQKLHKTIFGNSNLAKRFFCSYNGQMVTPNQTGGIKVGKAVVFDYSEVLDIRSNLEDRIEEAFGDSGLGLAVVDNIPNLHKLRNDILPLAQKLANLPKEQLRRLERPETFYSMGWSHGKEQYEPGKYDFMKGSFYAYTQCDHPLLPAEANKVGVINVPNEWPKDSLPELEYAFKNQTKVITNVASMLAKHLDRYILNRLPDYEPGKLQRIVTKAQAHQGRLLHYFPFTKKQQMEAGNADWCGWHKDHCALTGLMSAMYLNKKGEPVKVDDSDGGLMVYSRNDEINKVRIPPTGFAFQIGESLQILSGGLLRATPHAVITSSKLVDSGISRNTLALFHTPDFNEPVHPPTPKDIPRVLANQPKIVARLEGRWAPTDTYHEFAVKTFKLYQS